VPLCDSDAAMSEKYRDSIKRDASEEQLHGERIAESMRMAGWDFR